MHVVAWCCVLLHVTAVDQDSGRNDLHHFWEALLIVTHFLFLNVLVSFCVFSFGFFLVFLLFALCVPLIHRIHFSVSRSLGTPVCCSRWERL